jgi:exonuclease SbcC
MIPIKLSLSGFLSYRDPVEIDFTRVELACIAGPNGAGKSSLLDAITWALFGQARKRDESLINTQSNVAEVGLTFTYEGNVYRVQRTLPRGKTMVLEFHILQPGNETNGSGPSSNEEPGIWKPLTERTLRETQGRIEQVLHLNYETFVNASFFLQGKADQFTQQNPGDRKRILSNILGLDVWEGYKQRSAERRKAVEDRIVGLDGHLAEIQAELAEETERKARLAQLQSELGRLQQARVAQESVLESIRKVVALLEDRRKGVENLSRQLESTTRELQETETRLASRKAEKESYNTLLTRAQEVEAAYAGWQAARSRLEEWDAVAARFRDQDKRRQAPITEIEATRARLTQEMETLQGQHKQVEEARAEIDGVNEKLETARHAQKEAEEHLSRRESLDEELKTAQQRLADARAENPVLRAEMEGLKERIKQLSAAEGANCPFCGKLLTHDECQALIVELKTQGSELGDRFRTNQALLKEADSIVKNIEDEKRALFRADAELHFHTRTVDQLTDRLATIQQWIADWETRAALRLAEVETALAGESFAGEARSLLAEIDADLKSIGYDASAHDEARRAEAGGRSAEADLRNLEKARAALVPLEREIADLKKQVKKQKVEFKHLQEEYDRQAASLAEAQAQAPDQDAAEQELLKLQEQENRLRMDVGGARQKVQVLEDLRARALILAAEREEHARTASQYKQLERAFGKDGVPALLIEQALPQIEAKANEILDRLSGGNMSVRFITQAPFKDKRRDDLRETLDIRISDSSGTREYEMFSGGEAFRVNFAIRLALSEVLARRAGARLQTLIIDEGFGSQDTQGRQRLIEAINLVRQDFARILVITHIDELKDAFPMRIEIEKTPRGSSAHIA